MQDATSLENLRDIVSPQSVSWWPPAPGWWGVFVFFVLGVAVGIYQAWRSWKSNDYRRQALSEVNDAKSDAAIVEILKRAAIRADTRRHVGALSGKRWCKWLVDSGGVLPSDDVAERLAYGVYRDGLTLTPALADFAKRWISQHRIVPQEPDCES